MMQTETSAITQHPKTEAVEREAGDGVGVGVGIGVGEFDVGEFDVEHVAGSLSAKTRSIVVNTFISGDKSFF